MKTPSHSEQISAELRSEILRGRYRSGDRLPSERDLAQRFEVSRGAVREALKKLEQLGLAKIEAGGARVNPVEEASLDIVQHLLALSDPPDPRIVYEILEATSAIMALGFRLCAEHADEADHRRTSELLERLSQHDLSGAEEFELFTEVGDLVAHSSGNTVIELVHRGLRTRLLENLYSNEILDQGENDERPRLVAELARAFAARQGPESAEAVHQISAALRERTMINLGVKFERNSGNKSERSQS
ncbi:MAG: GntR family transcriptional regulator [Myxococcota bacterium]|nr:GntR family transcriptional regulator [Myxococcota bacterium]